MRKLARVRLNSLGKLGELEVGQKVKAEEAVVREPDLRRFGRQNSAVTVDEASCYAMVRERVAEVEWEVVEVLALGAEIARQSVSSN